MKEGRNRGTEESVLAFQCEWKYAKYLNIICKSTSIIFISCLNWHHIGERRRSHGFHWGGLPIFLCLLGYSCFGLPSWCQYLSVMTHVDLSRYCRICVSLASLDHLSKFYPSFRSSFHGAYPDCWPLSNLLSPCHVLGPLLGETHVSR